MIEEIFDSESGTTIHKASLQSGAFSLSGYGRFLAIAKHYLLAGFFAFSRMFVTFIHLSTL